MTERFRSGIGTGYQTQHGVDGHDGRTAVADKRQRQTDNGHGTDAHADVDDHLENQRGSGTKADQTAHIVRGTDAHIDATGNDGKLQQHNGDTAKETSSSPMEEKM